MSPFGKITLALLGLKIFGADGLFLGLFFGHMLIDKTFIIRRLEIALDRLDDIIRIKLPYKYYRYYNRLDGNIWGKLWGIAFGGLLFGFWGFVSLFILGQVLFDMPKNPDIRRFKKKIDHFFDNNWGKILGAIIGFVLKSPVLIFVGLIIGFFADYQRMESARLVPFGAFSKYWQKINALKLWRHSQSGEHRKYLEAMAALAALIAESEGRSNTKKAEAFQHVFAVKPKQKSYVREIFENKNKHQGSVEKYADILEFLTRDNDDLKESSLENLFKIATADETLTPKELKLLEQVAKIIRVDEAITAKLKKQFMPVEMDKKLEKCYQILGVSKQDDLAEIKAKWKKMILQHHPDRLGNASEKAIAAATRKMAEINLAYQEIVKAKGKR